MEFKGFFLSDEEVLSLYTDQGIINKSVSGDVPRNRHTLGTGIF